ncbi:cupin domain-containing protein, partial [Marinobacter sp.]|uniref:thiolase family protein n=1 Tax=Marinobacter sp. TaxID=50741 RepID=UPI0035C6697E
GNGTLVDSMIHDGLWDAFEGVHMGEGSDAKNTEYAISREAQDEWSAMSHERAVAAWKDGRFDDEVVSVEVPQRKGDPIVVETDDAVLVGKADRMQEVKTVVAQLKAEGRSEATWHRKVYRPWGAYDSIDNGERFQVKRITVKPGGTLSLQMHHHRAEHWIVVSGTAEVTRGDEVILLSENQSTYIPLGVTHRLRNPGKLPLELIEV